MVTARDEQVYAYMLKHEIEPTEMTFTALARCSAQRKDAARAFSWVRAPLIGCTQSPRPLIARPCKPAAAAAILFPGRLSLRAARCG